MNPNDNQNSQPEQPMPESQNPQYQPTPEQSAAPTVPLNTAPDEPAPQPQNGQINPEIPPADQPIPQPDGPSNLVVPAAEEEQAQPQAPTQDAISAVPSKKLAVISLALGVIGFLTGFLGIGILLGIAAIIIGIFVLIKHQAGKGLAIGGIVGGALAVLLGPVAFIIFLGSMASFQAVENSSTSDRVLQPDNAAVPFELEN